MVLIYLYITSYKISELGRSTHTKLAQGNTSVGPSWEVIYAARVRPGRRGFAEATRTRAGPAQLSRGRKNLQQKNVNGWNRTPDLRKDSSEASQPN